MALVIGISSLLAYRGVRHALESEFEARLRRLAETVASQIGASDVKEARSRDLGSAYLSIQVQLVTLTTATGIANASLLDSAGVTLVDAQAPETEEGIVSSLGPLAGNALARSRIGPPTVSAPFRREGKLRQAGFAAIRDSAGAIAGIAAVEANADHLTVAGDLARTLAGIAFVALLAVALLAALVIRGAASSTLLERRLTRSENLAAMGQLTATLAHEIKNPLAIIRASAQRLGKLEPEAQRMAEFVVDETDRLSRTVARYLQFARGDLDPSDTGDAVVSLEATLSLLEGEFRERRIRLSRPTAFPSPAPVSIDNESLKQVYLNLILNAVEAMEGGGIMTVAAIERPRHYEVTIADEGPGVSAEILVRLGRPFVTTKATGSGLGLFLAKRLVESAGGTLTIQNRETRGATCTVRLPSRERTKDARSGRG